MNKITMIKLGGSVITDKSIPYTARPDVIKRLSSEINYAHDKSKIKIIVGHGGGSFPHVSAHKYQVQKGVINKKSWEGFSKVQNDASKLNRIIVENLIEAGEKAVSIHPSSSCIAKDGRIFRWDTELIKTFIRNDILPVPYGDVVLDTKRGCCIVSTEEVLGYLAKNLGAKKIIMVGKVDGVLDNNGKLIEKIDTKNFNELKSCLKSSDSTDVTGGMMHKVEKMLELAKYGIDSIIINGLVPGNLEKELLNKKVVGTKITK